MEINCPLVSVVIPVYNASQYLRQCLDSVLEQTLEKIEVICVDDGSSDETPEILQEYAEKDSRIQIITQENAGPGVARNTGMSLVTGEYLIFLDSDDWFEKDFLESMEKCAAENYANVVVCRGEAFDSETGESMGSEWMMRTKHLPDAVFQVKDVADYLFQFTHGWPWDKLYRTQFIKENGLKYPALRNSEDLVFVFQSLALADTVAIVDRVFVHHRMNRKSSVSGLLFRAPESPCQALEILMEKLKSQDDYFMFEQSFLNWAMEFLVWYISSIEELHIQRTVLLVLRKKWLPVFEFDYHRMGYYRDSAVYIKYLFIRYAPCSLFQSLLFKYKRIKKMIPR